MKTFPSPCFIHFDSLDSVAFPPQNQTPFHSTHSVWRIETKNDHRLIPTTILCSSSLPSAASIFHFSSSILIFRSSFIIQNSSFIIPRPPVCGLHSPNSIPAYRLLLYTPHSVFYFYFLLLIHHSKFIIMLFRLLPIAYCQPPTSNCPPPAL